MRLNPTMTSMTAAVWLAFAAACGRTEPIPWPRCPPPFSLCGAECVNLLEDPLNCGGCGLRCGEEESCIRGGCLLVCPAGRTNCDGRCVDLSRDPSNCGSCGARCPAGQPCENGQCLAACPASLTRCGATCANLENDRQHCGACGQRCDRLPCTYCVGGLCAGTSGVFACQSGSCTDTGTDPRNCGACGTACGAGEVCDYDPSNGYLGGCFSQCTPGRTSCGGMCTDLQADARNCGACGSACPPCTVCSAGQCSATTGVLRCGRSCDSLQIWPGRGECSPCSTACDESGLACQRCAY